MAKGRTHLNPPRTKRQRRQALQQSRQTFRESMQDRTDLYAVTLSCAKDRHEARRRLKTLRRGIPCWDTDAENRLIVSRACLPLLKGIRCRKTRVITQRHLLERLQRILARCPGIKPHGDAAPVYDRIVEYLRTRRYFLATLCRRTQVTLLSTLAYANERGNLLSFSATTCG